jgi:hypothetical protein
MNNLLQFDPYITSYIVTSASRNTGWGLILSASRHHPEWQSNAIINNNISIRKLRVLQLLTGIDVIFK